MLNPWSNRLDYGDRLRPPPGHELSAAIATSYSLDLDALIAASLALVLDQSLDGDLAGAQLAFLESLDRLQDKLLVFYESGKVKIPGSYNNLYTLLEPLTVPVSVDEVFSAFHPKLWLLRFTPHEGGKPDRFRLLVLSRNLSFDRSWDLAVSIDSTTDPARGSADPALADFLEGLPAPVARKEWLRELCGSIRTVKWERPANFSEVRFLYKAEDFGALFDAQEKFDELLVVSPFVDADRHSLLQSLGQRCSGSRALVSRADTLDCIGNAALEGWKTLSVPGAIVDGENRLEQQHPQAQDLHAKLIVVRQRDHVVWHIGSANMTNAAFGSRGGDTSPRNTETMLRLKGKSAAAGPAQLLQQWTETGVFAAHEFGDRPGADPQQDRVFRILVHSLGRTEWTQTVIDDCADAVDLEVGVAELPLLPEGYTVMVSPLADPRPQPLAGGMRWEKCSLAALSAFLRIEIRCAAEGDVHHVFAVQSRFVTDFMAERRRSVFKTLIDSADKVLRFLRLVLDADTVKGSGTRQRDGDSPDTFDVDGHEGLYEQMLRAAAREPRRLERAVQLFQRLQKEGAPLPIGLEALFSGFVPHVRRSG